MAKKIDINLVRTVVEKKSPMEAEAIIRSLEEQIAKEEAEKEKKPKPPKKEFALLVSDPKGVLKGTEIVGWAVQINEGDDPGTIPTRIFQAAYEFNVSPKGRKLPVATVGEAMEVIPARFFKEQAMAVKTKTPVRVIRVPNKIPTAADSL